MGLVRLWSWRPTPAPIVALDSLRVWHDYLTTMAELPGGVLAKATLARCDGGMWRAPAASVAFTWQAKHHDGGPRPL